MSDVLDLIEKFGKTSNTLHERVFVCPIYQNRWVATRIDKIVYRFKVPRLASGWYRFQPVTQNKAKKIGEADLMEIERYLRIFDKFRLIMIRREGDLVFGIPFKGNKFGFKNTQIFPVFLTLDEMALDFDEMLCRFDGANIWYEQVPMSNDPARSEYLRDALSNKKKPTDINFQGLRFEDKIAYGIRYQLMFEEEERLKKVEEARLLQNTQYRLKRAVEHGGGVFVGYTERGSNFSVTYNVDGETYTSTIAKDRNLTVLSAGFCLSGGDKDFDLSSLMSVIREGQNKDLIYRW